MHEKVITAVTTATAVPTFVNLGRQISIRNTHSQCLFDHDQNRKPDKRRISISELPILGSLNNAKNLNSEHLRDPRLMKAAKNVAKNITKGAWRGIKVSAKLLFISPYLPLMLFFVLCDWVHGELNRRLTDKEDVESMSDWSTSSTLDDWCEDIRG